MYKVAAIGHFGFGRSLSNGQTIKTKIVTSELEKHFGENKVLKIDTHGGKKKIIIMPFVIFSTLRKSENVVIFPAHNGLRIIAPLLVVGNIFFRRKLHYSVIGGWLPDLLKKKKRLSFILKKFNYIYVETERMKKELENLGFFNIIVVPNCKKLKILNDSELIKNHQEPYRLCTFSRVMKEKGIEDAVKVLELVNKKLGRNAFLLDIYGQIDENQIEWFNDFKKKFPAYIKYCGVIQFDKSVEVLKEYFLLLFPTKFYTEGIPGTIIDSYAAGVPVISSKWESFSEVIEDGVTGIGYEFDDLEELENILVSIVERPYIIEKMKPECIRKAENYMPNISIKVLINNM